MGGDAIVKIIKLKIKSVVQQSRRTKDGIVTDFKNVIFVFRALNYTCWYDLFKKNRKLQEILGLQIYIYKDSCEAPMEN